MGNTLTVSGEAVATLSEDEGVVFAEGWDAVRVRDYLASAADQWRIDQSFNGGQSALDDAQLDVIEAGRDFYALAAAMEAGEHVEFDVIVRAIERMNSAGDFVIGEENYRLET